MKFLSWLGTAASIFGSFIVAFGMMQIGYVAFLLGSASWLIVGFARSDKPLIVLNLAFLSANIIGIVRAFS